MNRQTLQQKLTSAGIRSDSYSLEGGHPSEAYVLASEGRVWAIYYSERGQETSRREFDSEEAACNHLFTLLLNDSSTRI